MQDFTTRLDFWGILVCAMLIGCFWGIGLGWIFSRKIEDRIKSEVVREAEEFLRKATPR